MAEVVLGKVLLGGHSGAVSTVWIYDQIVLTLLRSHCVYLMALIACANCALLYGSGCAPMLCHSLGPVFVQHLDVPMSASCVNFGAGAVSACFQFWIGAHLMWECKL